MSAFREAFSAAYASAYALGGGGVGGGGLAVPVGFGWTPPYSIFKNGSVYSTNYDPAPFLVEGDAGVTTFYVDGDTGNDANPGTAVSPKKSLTLISAGRINKLLIKARGTFYVGLTSNIQKGHDNLCVEAWGGAACRLTMLADQSGVAPLVWTDTGGGVWSAPPPFAAFNSIQAFSGTNPATMVEYPLAANLAACQATPGTRFTAGGPLHYVHTLTGLSPVLDGTVYANGGSAQTFNIAASAFDQRVQFHGVSFLGGDAAMFVSGVSGFNKRVEFIGCDFRRSGNFGALHATGNATIICYDCIAGPSKFDGFSYTTASGSADLTPVPWFMEIDCVASGNGYVNTGANQGSTTHFGGKGVRVNCTYSTNGDDQVADVGTDTNSWNLGCTFGPRGEPAGDSGARAGNGVGNTSIWLDGCTFTGNSNDVGADPAGSTVFYKNMTLPGLKAGSTGTVASY